MRSRFDNAGIQSVSYYTATIKDDRDLDDAVRGATLLGARNITGDATGDVLRRIDERCTKQASGGEINVLLGSGIARIPEVMQELKKIEYRGLVAIEYEHEGAVEDDVRSEVEYARRFL